MVGDKSLIILGSANVQESTYHDRCVGCTSLRSPLGTLAKMILSLSLTFHPSSIDRKIVVGKFRTKCRVYI